MARGSEAFFKQLVVRRLKRKWSSKDGIGPARVSAAERRLKLKFPEALRALYRTIGALPDFCTIHNQVRAPEDVAVESEYLIFMDENEDVVTWGIRVKDLGKPDPVVWQRVNAPTEQWFSERKSVTKLFASMLAWYASIGVWHQHR